MLLHSRHLGIRILKKKSLFLLKLNLLLLQALLPAGFLIGFLLLQKLILLLQRCHLGILLLAAQRGNQIPYQGANAQAKQCGK